MSKLSQTQYGTGKFNQPFFELRDAQGWSQAETGKKIGGYECHTIMRVENGISGGKLDFWQAVQKTFNIPDEAMWSLMNGDNEGYKKQIRKRGKRK